MASIIFYGAGQNARENFDTWVKSGLDPVCFSDIDITKHHTQFRGGGKNFTSYGSDSEVSGL